MKKILITYGDRNYADRREQVVEEALATGEFDEVKAYSQEFPFPEAVRYYTEKFEKGGGFRLWKPLILLDALSKAEEGDIVVYVDAGSTLSPHKDWSRWFRRLAKYDMLLFRGQGRIGEWCARKMAIVVEPEAYKGKRAEKGPRWFRRRAVTTSVLMVRKNGDMPLLRQWAGMAERHPTLFADNSVQQDRMEPDTFREHRHDQAVLNALLQVLPKEDRKRIRILPEHFEHRYYGGQAIANTRLCPQLGKEHTMKKRGFIRTLFSKFQFFL